MSYLFLILSMMMILSCGKAVKNESDEEQKEEQNIDGTYSAMLVPVNGKISVNVHGDVRISKYSDEFIARVRLREAPPGTFIQAIQTGSSCPKMANDSNLDGYIDSYEARDSMGDRIVPLDGDLSSQKAGLNYSLTGNYEYRRATSYYLLLSDLHVVDDVINDQIVKLNGEDLPLERKVVAIYIKKNNLPLTVNGNELPVACGVLTRTSTDENTSRDEWQNTDETYKPRRPRPVPRPIPRPQPQPEPEVEAPPEPSNWWDRIRDTWNRWRNRWGGGGEIRTSGP